MYNFHSILECCVMFSGVKLSIRSFNLFQGFGNIVLALQIFFCWAAVLIPNLIALEHLMPVSSMWPVGPLVRN